MGRDTLPFLQSLESQRKDFGVDNLIPARDKDTDADDLMVLQKKRGSEAQAAFMDTNACHICRHQKKTSGCLMFWSGGVLIFQDH